MPEPQASRSGSAAVTGGANWAVQPEFGPHWKLPMAQAIALPNITSRTAVVEIEGGVGLEGLEPELKAMGHEVKYIEQNSGLNGFRITSDGIDAAPDARREGAVGKIEAK